MRMRRTATRMTSCPPSLSPERRASHSQSFSMRPLARSGSLPCRAANRVLFLVLFSPQRINLIPWFTIRSIPFRIGVELGRRDHETMMQANDNPAAITTMTAHPPAPYQQLPPQQQQQHQCPPSFLPYLLYDVFLDVPHPGCGSSGNSHMGVVIYPPPPCRNFSNDGDCCLGGEVVDCPSIDLALLSNLVPMAK